MGGAGGRGNLFSLTSPYPCLLPYIQRHAICTVCTVYTVEAELVIRTFTKLVIIS